MGFLIKLDTALRLGACNILRVLVYRLRCKLRIGIRSQPTISILTGEFFSPPRPADVSPLRAVPPESPQHFGWRTSPLTAGMPDWFLDPFSGSRFSDTGLPWYEIPDFAASGTDIKSIWELSRWGWLPRLVQQALSSHDGQIIEQLNAWLNDWVSFNPAYLGPNWKCGQEASLRVLNFALAARMLSQEDSLGEERHALLTVHLSRIAPTISYAVAQDNNHGTSEAAALFVGGSWLARAEGDWRARRWERQGRRMLEERVSKLIMADGSFSQYSVNYHRLMLDTLSLVELWRASLKRPAFSEAFYRQAARATKWLHAMVQPETGDAPNIGANDGAHLISLAGTDYRDFRPSVQLASALFLNRRAFKPGPWDSQLDWLGVVPPLEVEETPDSQVFDEGGFVLLRRRSMAVWIRFPRFRFRPSHADALHLDLWRGGENWLRDAGTYSYNTSDEDLRYFPGTESHNTVQFDGRDQMPRLSRFLYGAWLSPTRVGAIEHADGMLKWSGAYRDWMGASHSRSVSLGESLLLVEDAVAGFTEKAILRWRLRPGVWKFENGFLRGEDGMIVEVQCDRSIAECRLVEGYESRYYQVKTPLPVLEVEVKQPCTLTTRVSWE